MRTYLLNQSELVECSLSLGNLPIKIVKDIDRGTAPLRTFDGLYACSTLMSMEEEMENRMRQKKKKIRKKEIACNISTTDVNRMESTEDESSSQRKMNNDTYNSLPDLGACTCLDENGNIIQSMDSSSSPRIPCGHSDCQAPYILLFTIKNSSFAGQCKVPKEMNEQEKQQNRSRRKSNSDRELNPEFHCGPGPNLPRVQSDVTSVMINTLLNAWKS